MENASIIRPHIKWERNLRTRCSIYDTNRRAQVKIIANLLVPIRGRRSLFAAKVEFSNNLNDTFVVWDAATVVVRMGEIWKEKKIQCQSTYLEKDRKLNAKTSVKILWNVSHKKNERFNLCRQMYVLTYTQIYTLDVN